MLDQVKDIGWDALKSTTGIIAINMAGVPSMVRKMIPSDIKPAGYLADGVIYALVGEGIDYFSGDQSTIINGDWYGYIDNIAFMGVASGVVNESGISNIALQQISNVSPFDEEMNLNLTEGLVVSAARAIGDFIDITPLPDQIKYLRHPTRLIR